MTEHLNKHYWVRKKQDEDTQNKKINKEKNEKHRNLKI